MNNKSGADEQLNDLVMFQDWRAPMSRCATGGFWGLVRLVIEAFLCDSKTRNYLCGSSLVSMVKSADLWNLNDPVRPI
jgi:hypothetical protein